MITANEKVKNVYDSCHALATSGGLRASDHEKILHISGLFDCESTNYDMTPISEMFIVSEVRIPEITKQNIARLVSALDGKILLTLASHTTMEELQLNHIIMDMYLNIINKKIATESSELQLIAKYLSCLFNSIWSSHDHIKLKWDKPSTTTMKSDPTNCKTRPDIIFYTNINEKEIELGNAEIKKKTMQKTEVDEARTRILSVCKRQLHLKMRQTHRPEELVTFGVLVHGFRYEFYITSYVDGFYPFEKFAWEFNDQILPKERAPTAESDISEMNLLPTATYCTSYYD
ncbi:hypothetical protein CLU79DRAFT_806773 [Phycomyces nitens]|nr:hypothetical protein CLU79DRAFT_806773 [Phycomyces nitens]